MTISDDLFRAILAMDAYNRGAAPGIAGLGGVGTQIGNATISLQSDVTPGSPEVVASFSATAYSWNNHQVISYRGTDNLGTDPLTGWLAAIGSPSAPQAQMAAQFYQDVINNPTVSPYNSTVEFTGHSLGGGLAGFMGGLYGKKAVIFDNMPFEKLTNDTHDLPPLPSDPTYQSYYFNGSAPAPVNFSQVSGYYTTGEVLETSRALQTTPLQALDIGPNVDLPGVDSGLFGGNLHSMSLLALELFAAQTVPTADWKAASKFFMPYLFDDALATTFVSPSLRGSASDSDIMRDAIAYSAIDVGTRVFGDTGIRALFDDATDLGKVPGVASATTFIGAAADSISKIFVQYAGQLAIGKKLDSQDANFKNGVLTLDQAAGKLTIDLDPNKWTATGVNTAMDIKGRDTLTTDLFSAIKNDNALNSPHSAAFTDYVKPLWTAADSSNVTKAVFVTGGGTTISETSAPDAKSGAKGGVLLVGNSGNDTLTAGDGRDLLAGGVGIDELDGGKGNDFLFGGQGNDRLKGGLGSDIIDGGQGTDLADYSDFNAGRTFDISRGQFNYSVGYYEIDVTDVATSDVDRLFNVEEAKLGVGADTIRLNENLKGGKRADLKIDGGGAPTGAVTDPTQGDTLDFSSSTNGVVVKDAADGSDASELYGKSGDATTETGIKLSNFERVTGSASADIFNLSKLTPGGAPNSTEQAQIDAAKDAFYAAMGTGAYVAAEAFQAAKAALLQALQATTSYQQTILVDGGDGNDVIQGTASGQGTLVGGAGFDVLIGGDFGSFIDGGSGLNLLVAGGLEDHLNGANGQDLFALADGAHIENAGTDDDVSWASFHATGGVQQWWMENGWGYWASTASIVGSALGAFGSVLSAMNVATDTRLMTTLRYTLSESGQLVIQYGRGRGGQAVIEDYKADSETGEASGNVTVFKQLILDGKQSIADLREFVKSAIAAGFGYNVFASDPLVIDLDGDGIELKREANGVYFDLDNDTFAEHTAWVRPDDGFLVRDLNANGKIDTITEMFGNASTSGFSHLSALDSNADSKINSLDTGFSTLKVWRDLDQDGVTDAGELQTLTQAGIKEISLSTTAHTNDIVRGTTIRSDATVTRTDNTTTKIYDAAFEVNETDSTYLGNSTVSGAAALLPELKGYGTVTNLRVAMTNDTTLFNQVTTFKNMAATSTWQQYKHAADDVLYRWAHVDTVSPVSMGGGAFDRQKLAFLETYFGYQLTPRDGNGVPSEANIAELIKSWNEVLEKETIKLALQGPLKTLFSGISYDAAHDRLVAAGPTSVADAVKAAILQLSATPATALSQWTTSWGPLLSELFTNTDRADHNAVRTDYAVQSLVKALDGTTTSLTLTQFVSGLALQGVQIGTDNNDILTRTDAKGTQVYVGGGGSDTINGGVGQDVYVYGRNFGQDVINDIEYTQNGDRIRFAVLTANDVTMTRVGLDLVIQVKNSTDKITIKDQFATPEYSFGGQQISPNYGVEEIQFADGKIYEAGDIAGEVGRGTMGADNLVGTGTADELDGLAGDDLLNGGDSGDIYYFGRGYGHDTIHDVRVSPLLNTGDSLIMVNGISAKDVIITRVGASDDVTLTLKSNPADSVTIQGQFAYDVLDYNSAFSTDSRMEAIVFTIGASWGITDLQQATIATYTTSGNDQTYGFGTPDDFFASAGNDLLVGFDGGDTYRFGIGSGQDTIHDQSRYPEAAFFGLINVNWSSTDTVQFGDGLTAANVHFTRLGAAPDLTITIDGQTDTLTIKDQFLGDKLDLFGFIPVTWFSRVESFKFADGTTLTWEDVLHQVTTGGAGADQLYGAYYTDTLDGKAGNDYLSGGDDGDTYLFGRGYGQDVIEDNQTNVLTTTDDTLKFGANISVSDIKFTREAANPFDLKVSILGTTDTVTLKNEFDYVETGVFGTHYFDRIEKFQWVDGTIKDISTIVQEIITSAKTTGNDSIYGTYGSETLDGGAGNDYLDGDAGSDTYIMARGYGNDVIHETNLAHFTDDNDRVLFGAGILPTDVTLTRYGTDLLGLKATINASGGSISIDNQFKFWIIGPNRAEVEQFQFQNGTIWDTNTIRLTYLAQSKTTGADSITGFFTNDVIDGGAGNDILDGINGSDTYIVGIGSGQDTISETTHEYTENDDVDVLQFGAGLTQAQVSFSRVGNDLVLSWNGAADKVTVTGQFNPNGTGGTSWSDIERITFTDGTVLTAVDVANKILAAASTSAANVLNGSFYAERFDGLGGNDTLRGGGGGDTYVFKLGMGQDTIEETVPDVYLNQPDTVEFAAGIARTSVSFTRVGNDLVASIGTGEKVTIKNQFTDPYAKVEFFKFADGSTVSAAQAELGATLAQSTSGNDTIIGTAGDDVLDGGAGNDILKGKEGNDTFVFGRGSGQDIIDDNDQYPYATSWSDKVSFLAGVRPQDLALTRSGVDLIISISGTADTLTIVGQFTTTKQDVNNQDRIESFLFADGTKWTAEDVDQRLIKQATTGGAETIVGYDSDDTFAASAGNDTLKGGYGNDTYNFDKGSGQDTIDDNDVYHYSTSWSDKVAFGQTIDAADLVLTRSGNDLVIGITGSTDTLTVVGQFLTTKQDVNNLDRIESFIFSDGSTWTAAGVDLKLIQKATTSGNDTTLGYDSDDSFQISAGNDLLRGFWGNDTYAFGRGAGQDTIDDNDTYHYSTSWADKVAFATNVATSDIQLSRAGNDLIIKIAGTTDQLTIQGQFYTTLQDVNNIDRIESFAFTDGTIWSAADVDKRLLLQASTSGNDTIVAYDSADILDGGAGNDTLKGGYGNDTYIFGRGYGQDIVDDNDQYPYSTSISDQVLFKDGITQADVRFSRTGDDLVIKIAGASDQLTIKNQFSDVLSSANNWDRIETFTFADQTFLTGSEIDALVLAGQISNGNDTLVGYNAAETLDGGLGNDVLKGLGGNDTYIFGRGYGQDTAIDNEGYSSFVSDADKVAFKPGIALSNLQLSRLGNDLVITIAGTTDKLTIQNQFIDVLSSANNYARIETFVMGDGSVLAASVLDANTLVQAATSAADTIVGYNSNDLIEGKLGADLLQGQQGSDTYVYASGDGADVIDEYDNAQYDQDRVRFTNLNAADLTFSRSGDDLTIRVNATNQSISVQQHFLSSYVKGGVEVIQFANGTTWNLARLNAAATGSAATYGTVNADTLTGTAGADVIFGEDANDTLSGAGGNDIIGGGAGNDTLDGGLGSDTLYGDAGNDTMRLYQSAAGDFDSIYGGDGIDTVTFASFASAVYAEVNGLYYDAFTSDAATYVPYSYRSIAEFFDIENLTGTAYADQLFGDAGANTLNGGAGADILAGGAGDDVYVVDSASDVVTELAGGGTDTVQSSVAYSLVDTDGSGSNGGNVEKLTLTGTAAINGTGNDFNNTLTGNSAANILSGGQGDDTLSGGAGADTLIGGLGNDSYVVDVASDIVTELAGQGTDTIQSSVTFSLADSDGAGANGGNVENLTLTGTAAINATGNALGNVIIGNSANNTLDGGTGTDTLSYSVATAAVSVSLGVTAAQATGGAGTDTIANFENLTGSNYNDTLQGSAGNNILDGGTGTDTLSYAAATAAITISLASTAAQATGGAGSDTVRNFENLTGSAFNDTLTGSTAANVIIGGAGNDKINGGLGNDSLTGGAGADIFVFNTALGASNIDAITDFVVVDDTFNLENTGTGLFTALTATGAIAASAFWTGTAAHLASDRIIYNSATGDLFYDLDGTGAAAQIKFATVSTGLALTNADFVVI